MDRDPLMARLVVIVVTWVVAATLILLAGLYLTIPFERIMLLLAVLLIVFLYPWILAFIMVKTDEEERSSVSKRHLSDARTA